MREVEPSWVATSINALKACHVIISHLFAPWVQFLSLFTRQDWFPLGSCREGTDGMQDVIMICFKYFQMAKQFTNQFCLLMIWQVDILVLGWKEFVYFCQVSRTRKTSSRRGTEARTGQRDTTNTNVGSLAASFDVNALTHDRLSTKPIKAAFECLIC